MHTHDSGEDTPHIQLSPGRRARQDRLSGISVRYDYNPRTGRKEDRITVPTNVVQAPNMIIRFRPMNSSKKKTIKLPVAHPISFLVSRHMNINAKFRLFFYEKKHLHKWPPFRCYGGLWYEVERGGCGVQVDSRSALGSSGPADQSLFQTGYSRRSTRVPRSILERLSFPTKTIYNTGHDALIVPLKKKPRGATC